MRRTSASLVSIAVSLVVALEPLAGTACGGKIAGDDRGGGFSGNGEDSSSSPPPPSSSPSGSTSASPPFTGTPPPSPSPSSSSATSPGDRPSVEDACGAICDRNGRCGADQTDCKERCADEISGASSCSPQANAFIQCYAANLLEGCASLPPVCESAYCAYTICAGKVVPAYCH